ncbi:MAG: AMP-binding protein [Desulfobacteraceae bacterium]|nr:MAG: AMP-binding protein [Desulfobacteraceae bacterium]
MSYDDKPWLKSYDEDVNPEVQIPDVSLVVRFDEVLELFPKRPAIHFFGKTLTYQKLISHANRFGRELMENECQPGDVVGINLPNIPQYLVCQIGALKAGCVTSGISPLFTPGEMTYQLNDCKAKALITLDAIFEHRLLKIADQLPHLKFVVVTGILDFLPRIKQILGRVLRKVPTGRVTHLPGKTVTQFMAVLARFPDEAPGVKVVPEDHCLVQYTGGTTGTPKGAVLTHRNLMANLTQIREWSTPETGKDIVLSGFPFFHLAGLIMGVLVVSEGGAQILIPDPRDTKHIIREMARYRPSVLVNVPSLYLMLLGEPGFRKLDFSGLKFCISGAAPFPVEGIKELEKVVGTGKLVEVYGMTETSPIITMNPREGNKKTGTVGLPIQSTRVKLVDLETGTREVPVGEEGEIIVKGPQVMKGYLNKPEETDVILRELDGERWLYMGDVARMDDEGYLTIVDRSKDMLNVGGFKVFSREVEDKLHDHPAIELCAVIGIPNPKRPGSELVKLVVQVDQAYGDVKKEDIKEEILLFARERLSPYKVPKIIEFTEKLPLTPVGKVDKKALRRDGV